MPKGAMSNGAMLNASEKLAETVRQAVIEAMLETYEDAGMRGLCAEGRFEAAVSAARTLDLRAILSRGDSERSVGRRET